MSPPVGKIIETYEDIESSDDDQDSILTKLNQHFSRRLARELEEHDAKKTNSDLTNLLQKMQEDDIRRHHKELRELVEQRNINS